MTIKSKMKQAYDLAYKYEDQGGHCSQSTFRALMDIYEIDDPTAFRSLGTLAGGCGAYSAALYFFGMAYGLNVEDTDSGNPPLKNGGDAVYDLAKPLHHKFIGTYGSIICSQIHRKLFKRPFYIGDKAEHKLMAKFVQDNKSRSDFIWCAHVCGNAAKWAVEIFDGYPAAEQNH